MQIQFNFKNFEPSAHLKKYASRRFEKLGKYLTNGSGATVQINLEVEKFRHMAEVVLSDTGTHISAREESEDMYSTIDLVLDKLEAQLRKTRDKVKAKRKGGVPSQVRMDVISYRSADGGQRERTIVQTDRYEPKPMGVDEAAMQLETLGYEFLVFYNAEIDRINVIYRRKSGDFGLIDPGM
ncbi:MAG: ribosome hibernation-promoting factor, HPF/YfiA family [Desulfovibrionales bacterium]